MLSILFRVLLLILHCVVSNSLFIVVLQQRIVHAVNMIFVFVLFNLYPFLLLWWEPQRFVVGVQDACRSFWRNSNYYKFGETHCLSSKIRSVDVNQLSGQNLHQTLWGHGASAFHDSAVERNRHKPITLATSRFCCLRKRWYRISTLSATKMMFSTYCFTWWVHVTVTEKHINTVLHRDCRSIWRSTRHWPGMQRNYFPISWEYPANPLVDKRHPDHHVDG